MDKNLLEQAKKNVLKHRENELDEEIREEQKRLIYESEKLKVTDAKAKEIAALKQTMGSFPRHQMWEGYMFGGKCAQLEEMLKTKRYHPKELEDLKSFAVAREQDERKRKMGPF